ncbi:MAG: hypothetical protein FWC51_01675 [Proteobacteria bacterium]|nr:hypothetical protein [Pseudomonadota bacterium]
MKRFIHFIAAAILAGVAAGAIPAGAANADTPISNRARPGSISGAFVSQAQLTAAAAANAIPPKPANNTDNTAKSSLRSPLTNNILTPSTDDNGNAIYIDPITGSRFVYDQNGRLQLSIGAAAPVDPDDAIIPELGVSIKVARAACAGIYADAHQAVFDETTYQCLIPVVAHNWSGVMSANGGDIVAWAPMGNMLTCNSHAFENVSSLYKTSQWVIPVMILGGAGVGAGIGALIDSHEAKVAAENAKKQKEAADALKTKVNATLSAGVGMVGDTSATYVTYNGVTYQLRKANAADTSCADCDPSAPGRAELIAALKPSVGGNSADLGTYAKSVLTCLKQNFREMVSTNNCAGDLKLGRIKITADPNGCLTNGGNRLYCWYDDEHIRPSGGGIWSDCNTDGRNSGRETARHAFFASNGQCYYRDEITAQRADANQYKSGAGQFALFYDTTAADDVHRWGVIMDFKARVCDNAQYAAVTAGAGEFAAACQWANDVANNFSGRADKANAAGNTFNYFVVNAKGSKTFGDMVAGVACGACAGANGALPSLSDETVERLREQYGALSALQNYAGPDDSAALNQMLASIAAKYNVAANLSAQIGAIDGDIDNMFGTDAAAKKKGFFQKNVGKGLLIGTGVGALGGLAYYFAEGASVFCNVGGLAQPKMNKSYSIPSFRQYIADHGYLNLK